MRPVRPPRTLEILAVPGVARAAAAYVDIMLEETSLGRRPD